MIRLPVPGAVHGESLSAELCAAGAKYATVQMDRDELLIDTDAPDAKVRSVVAAHVPPSPASTLTLVDRLAAIEARLDKAASAAVTGEAAKLRDNLKPVN